MSTRKKLISIVMIVISLCICIFAYDKYLDAKIMWDLGDVSNLTNVPCEIKSIDYSSKVAIVNTLDNQELEIKLGYYINTNDIHDTIGVVYDSSNNPVTSFNNYYQTIQIGLFSIFGCIMTVIVTIIFIVLAVIDNKEDECYMEEYMEEYIEDDLENMSKTVV